MRASTLSNWDKPPFRASFIASMVTVFGIRGANGSAFSRATLVSNNRTASDRVSPIGSQHGGRLFLDGPVNAGLNELIGSHDRFSLVM